MNSLEHSREVSIKKRSNQLPWGGGGALCDVFACKFSFAGVGFRKTEVDNTSNRQICAKTRQVIL